MAILKYKTRGQSSPQGKAKIWFCCHPEDFKAYFEPICKEILDLQNCSIWYDEEPLSEYNEETFLSDLSQMRMMVVPVTSRFLYQSSRAREVEFSYAIEHHIPVLPLMQESGLESDFNRICGELQMLDKNKVDPTALPYEDKLKNFLNAILIGDKMAAKIREAFDAYVFLSYRKKDRKYAQELMRLIHENDFCRDIAIWYDEFLTPGENFNSEIGAALDKSKLFAMV
ncbi:MAG: toll/interleukin-1 receptor domain-containing protein, partial [Erysipelotrichaceae bacterium]|nr:toll/interleukin-1 receptor domain-containing protein [Erysipelotrichaceae bacterium]